MATATFYVFFFKYKTTRVSRCQTLKHWRESWIHATATNKQIVWLFSFCVKCPLFYIVACEITSGLEHTVSSYSKPIYPRQYVANGHLATLLACVLLCAPNSTLVLLMLNFIPSFPNCLSTKTGVGLETYMIHGHHW